MVEEGEPDPEFEAILDTVDPNRSVTDGERWDGALSFSQSLLLCDHMAGCGCRDGNVSLQEYMAFMISRETENVKSSEEIESAFRALSTENKPYVTKEELYQVSGADGGWGSGMGLRAGLTSPPSLPEPNQGAGGLLPVPYEALPGQQRPRASVSLRLCGVHPLALRQLTPGPPVTNQDAFVLPHVLQHDPSG